MHETVKVYAHCLVCGKILKRSIKLPISWVPLDPCMHYVRALCHEHRNINKFIEENCNYCTHTYGTYSCGLYKLREHIRACGYSGIGAEYNQTLSNIKNGTCPYRIPPYGLKDDRSDDMADGGEEMYNYLLGEEK